MNYVPNPSDIDLEAWEGKAEQAYSDACIAMIAKKSDFPDEYVQEFGQFIRHNGAIYLNWKHAAEKSAMDWKSCRQAISRIKRSAQNLLSDIEALDEIGEGLFWYPSRSGNLFRGIEPGSVGPYGHTVRRIPMSDNKIAVIGLRENDIREAITIIQNYAANALASLPKSSDGRPSNYALSIWVSNIQQFWVKRLKRRFTFSTIESFGKSKAFRFCMDAIAPLDRIRDSEMQTAVRSVVKEGRLQRKQKTGKNSL